MISWKRVWLVATIAAVSTVTAEVLRQYLIDDAKEDSI